MNTISNTKRSSKQVFLILFLAALLADLVFTALGHDDGRLFTKPLLMILLAAHFLSRVGTRSPGSLVLMALFFSWAGDVLLQFEQEDPNFFMFGLAAFLIAHVFYIIFFRKIWIRESIRLRPLLLLVVLAYYATLMVILFPYLGDMKVPVPVYGFVISTMLLLALHMPGIRNSISGNWMMAGALLFIISDSVLAFNKFYQPFSQAGLVIMLTYGLAQLFLVTGAIKYIRSSEGAAVDGPVVLS